MKWIEIRIESEIDNTEEASQALLEVGAGGTQIQNPKEIKSLIDHAGASELADYRDFSSLLGKYITIAYLPTGINLKKLKGALKKMFPDADISTAEVDDSQWEGNWKKYYKPFKLTESFRVVPSWESKGRPARNEIVMDPGLAFGTGLHESTKLCGALVEKNIKKDDAFLDIGTGTGILSIMADKKGADRIVAFDISETAVKTARENLEINGVHNALVFKGELTNLEGHLIKNFRAPFKFDVVATNIVSDIIIALAADIRNNLKEGGKLVCSGIIAEREDDVIEALKKNGYTILEVLRENAWTAICANA